MTHGSNETSGNQSLPYSGIDQGKGFMAENRRPRPWWPWCTSWFILRLWHGAPDRASNLWGTPRTTHDLDFVILLRPEQVDRSVDAFADGFFIQQDSVRSVFQPPYQFNVLDEQSALKADFWQLRRSEFEQEMFRRRVRLELFGAEAWVATPEDILLHKLYWNHLTPSERQLSDAAGVYAVQSANLDLDHLQRWASRLNVSAQLDDLITGKVRPKST